MSFFSANIWKSSFLKNIGSLFSSPKNSLKCVLISENGISSLIELELSPGYAAIVASKMTWAVINILKMRLEGCEEMVLPISERSYIPLDPLGRLDDADREKLISLDQIAKAKRLEARSRVTDENKRSINAELIKTMIFGLVFICIIGFIVLIFKG